MKLKGELLITGLTMLFAIATFWFSGNFLHIFLIWNMMLAIIPFVLLKMEKNASSKALRILVILAWVLFYQIHFTQLQT